MRKTEWNEQTQWLRVWATLADDMILGPSAHTSQLITTYISRDLTLLACLDTGTHMHTAPPRDTKLNIRSLF